MAAAAKGNVLDFKREFHEAVRKNRVDFSVRGMLASDDRVFPLGTDTKVLSTIFELFVRPLVVEIATKYGYGVKEAVQTVYPDFTLLRDPEDRAKIAVDVKTTYRRPDIIFTLGSYTSFLRNNTKNICYPYDHYIRHWVVGFVYNRRLAATNAIVPLDERTNVVAPYTDVEWFVQEKYKIAGESPGSGNTRNIGSIRKTRLDDFVNGNGPFAELGEEVFRDYWANYPVRGDGPQYRNIRQYLEWKRPTRR